MTDTIFLEAIILAALACLAVSGMFYFNDKRDKSKETE